MGIDRFQDGEEHPGQKAHAGLPRDTDHPGDSAPDNSPREPPEMADAEVKRAELRTRSEYADHVSALGSRPIEEDSPKPAAQEPSHSEHQYAEAMPSEHEQAERSHSAAEPYEQHAEESWSQEQSHTPNDSAPSIEEQRSPADASAEPAGNDNRGNNTPSEWHEEQHDHVKTELEQDKESDDDPVSESGAGEPSTVNDLDSPAPHDSPTQEPGRGTGLEQEGTPSEIGEHARPLTDKEWAEHLAEVRNGLDWAREQGLESHLTYTTDPDHQSWSKERRELHNSIINDFYSAAHDIPNEGNAIVAGGLGGAGKTTVLTENANIDPSQYLVINPDNFKEAMAKRGMIPQIDGLSPMEASDLVHEESSYLARQLALRAYADRKNLIWDITMSNETSTSKRLNELSNAGYTRIDGIFVDIPVETSVRRTESRHREGHDQYRAGHGLGGRYVPPEVIRSQDDPVWGSHNRRTFDRLKARFNNWTIYDNSIDGRSAQVVESNRVRPDNFKEA